MPAVETDEQILESLLIPYSAQQKLQPRQMSKNVYYLGGWTAIGMVHAKRQLWNWKQMYRNQKQPGVWTGTRQMFRSLACAQQVLDTALAGLKDCVVFSTTPTWFSQYQNACLLRSRGFELVGGKCYKNPAYPALSSQLIEHPGVPDRYLHWEHIWMRVLGQPKVLGDVLPGQLTFNNCGVDGRQGLDAITRHAATIRGRTYLTVGWLPRGVLFPKGWKRFYSAEDYKLGVNFEAIAANGSTVQDCPHNFDLKIFDGWEPDFTKWTPS